MGKKALPLSNLDEIGKRLETLRKNKGFSQGEAAAEIGISQQNLSRYESAAVEPPAGALLAMAIFYAVSVDYLLTGQRVVAAPISQVSSVPEWLQPHMQALESLSDFDRGRLEGRIAGWLENLETSKLPEKSNIPEEHQQTAVAGLPRNRDGTR